MALTMQLSAYLEATESNIVKLVRSLSSSNAIYTQLYHNTVEISLAPLASDQKVNLFEVIKVRTLFIESDYDITAKLGSSTNTALPIQKFILLQTDFTADPDPLTTTGLFLSNPSSTDTALVKISAIGTSV